MKKYLHDNKELFNKVAQRQEVWNKFMELERRAKVSIVTRFILALTSTSKSEDPLEELLHLGIYRIHQGFLMREARAFWWRRRRGTRCNNIQLCLE